MDDERQQDGLSTNLVNVVGLMSNNLSQYTHEKLYYAHCTGSSMYICHYSLYIYRVVVQGVCHVPL